MGHEYGFWNDPKTWVAVSFVIFFVLFGSKVWAALTGMLDKRAELVTKALAMAVEDRAPYIPLMYLHTTLWMSNKVTGAVPVAGALFNPWAIKLGAP